MVVGGLRDFVIIPYRQIVVGVKGEYYPGTFAIVEESDQSS